MKALSTALALACLSGCAGTVLRSGLAPGRSAPGFEQRWHPTLLFGSISLKHAYDLDAICPTGWAEVRLENDEFTLAAGLLTAFIYSPSRLTIVCAAAGAPGPPAIDIYTSPHVGGVKREYPSAPWTRSTSASFR